MVVSQLVNSFNFVRYKAIVTASERAIHSVGAMSDVSCSCVYELFNKQKVVARGYLVVEKAGVCCPFFASRRHKQCMYLASCDRPFVSIRKNDSYGSNNVKLLLNSWHEVSVWVCFQCKGLPFAPHAGNGLCLFGLFDTTSKKNETHIQT